jgi:hypothetical protein
MIALRYKSIGKLFCFLTILILFQFSKGQEKSGYKFSLGTGNIASSNSNGFALGIISTIPIKDTQLIHVKMGIFAGPLLQFLPNGRHEIIPDKYIPSGLSFSLSKKVFSARSLSLYPGIQNNHWINYYKGDWTYYAIPYKWPDIKTRSIRYATEFLVCPSIELQFGKYISFDLFPGIGVSYELFSYKQNYLMAPKLFHSINISGQLGFGFHFKFY